MSRLMRKPSFCICENKRHSNHLSDQCLYFRFINSTTPLLLKYKISNLEPSSVVVQPGLCWTWSEIRKAVLSVPLLYAKVVWKRTTSSTSGYLSSAMSLMYPTRSETNQTVQPQKMARGLKLWI